MVPRLMKFVHLSIFAPATRLTSIAVPGEQEEGPKAGIYSPVLCVYSVA